MFIKSVFCSLFNEHHCAHKNFGLIHESLKLAVGRKLYLFGVQKTWNKLPLNVKQAFPLAL